MLCAKQAHRAALAAHAQAEGRLKKVKQREDKVDSSSKPIQESVKKVRKIAATDKAAFRDILKGAVGKLLKNFGNENAAGGKLDKKSSATFLDGLLTQLKSGKKEKEEPSSFDDLVNRLEEHERGKDRDSSLAESFLDHLVRNQARNRKSSRRFSHRSRLDRLLANIHRNDYDYDFNFEDNFGLFKSPRHLDYFDDDYSLLQGNIRSSSRLSSAMRSSQKLEDDLEYLLRKLERERN